VELDLPAQFDAASKKLAQLACETRVSFFTRRVYNCWEFLLAAFNSAGSCELTRVSFLLAASITAGSFLLAAFNSAGSFSTDKF
jgi:hypothetical protein